MRLLVIVALLLTITSCQTETTAWDDCRSFAYNHSCTVWDVPDSLWVRLEQQALREGQSAEEFVCQRIPRDEEEPCFSN